MDRERLTITLKKDLLKLLDEGIDGVKIRNRSHAIEFFLSQVLSPKVSQAVILAGGQGVKMRPLTYEIPKSLIPVRGRPVIEYTIDLLRNVGIRDIIIVTGYLGERIKETLGNGQKYGVKITYSHENRPLGSAGALRNAKDLLSDKPFLVINGDVLIKINISEFINFHESDKYVATIALSTKSDTYGYGTVLLRGEKILDFASVKTGGKSQLINAGLYIFNPEIFNYIPKTGKVYFDDIFPVLAKERKLSGFTFEGDWFDISTPKNYEQAVGQWRS